MRNTSRPVKLRRSVLYVPADNERALAKSHNLDADCLIYDLEDAVAPEAKAQARENLRKHFADHPHARAERAIRINALSTEFGTEDLMCARACQPDAIVLPKVNMSRDILELSDALDEMDTPEDLQIFAMIETAKGILNIGDIADVSDASGGRLSCFIVGLNDLITETQINAEHARQHAHSWLMQILLAARAGTIDVIDSVYNDFRDTDGFNSECFSAVEMGFDGKSLIHPSQIQATNLAFMPNESELIEADAIVSAFRLPENQTKGVISLNGKMVERLHLVQAEALLAKAAIARASLGH